MRNQIKLKIFIIVQIMCSFLFGTALTVFAAGALSLAVSSSAVKTGDTVTVTVYAEGEGGTAVSADMNVTYDTSKLEYVSSSASSASGGGGTVKASGSEVEIKFKAVGSGDAYVKAESGSLTAAGTHITVSGGASGTDASAGQNAANAAKSGDNSLSSLKISHGTLSPAFKGSITEYTAEVGSDVNEITVTPVTTNSKATVESITGNTDLKEGKNVITIVVKAESGTSASYKITVTKKGTSASSPTNEDGEDGAGGEGGEKQPETSSETGQGADGDAIVIDGQNYKISGDFTDEEMPEGFSRTDFMYKGKTYGGIVFDSGYLGMYYLVNDAGEGKFFIYDENRDKFYPYVRLTNGEHFIILMTVPNGVIPPDNYEETSLDIGDAKNIPAYRYTGSEGDEIVKLDPEDGEMINGGAPYFYIFYGMDPTGYTCWYQYDTYQGTYQRLNEEVTVKESVPEDYEALAKSYQELDERQKATRIKDRRIIAILIFIAVALFIIILNLFLKIRELKRDDEEQEEENPVRRVRPKKEKQTKKIERVERVVKKEPEDTSFYDDDDDGFMDEFEEDPVVLGRRPKKKEKAGKQPDRKPVVLEDDGDDDDIEFLDL